MRYQDIYPSPPLLESGTRVRPQARRLLTLEYFEAEPNHMPEQVFSQHHVLLNLRVDDHRVEHVLEGRRREFVFKENEVIVTPAGLRSGWRWHARSRVIVVTLDPMELERFARNELGIDLTPAQLREQSHFGDAELCAAALLLK
ncbi:MAG: AraC family transcriptional regulator, partial [Myxococcota bacterium]